MAGYTEENVKTFQSSAALGTNLRVKLSSGKLALASGTELEIGTTERPVFAADADTPVRLRNATGTRVMTASVAIAVGGDVFAAASGKVAATGTLLIGTALSAATADGDLLEVLPVAPAAVA